MLRREQTTLPWIRNLAFAQNSVLVVGTELAPLLSSLGSERRVVLESEGAKLTAAKDRYPELLFRKGYFSDAPPEQPFDMIVIAEQMTRWRDVRKTLLNLRRWMRKHTRLVLTLPNPASQWLRSHRSSSENWIGKHDLKNLLRLSDFNIESEGSFKLKPYLVATLAPRAEASSSLTCSVIVPTRNEVGNITDCVRRIPEMGAGTEIVFVDGHSNDGTVEAIEAEIAANPHKKIRLIHQLTAEQKLSKDTERELERVEKIGKMLPQGKADAVRKGFRAAGGDVLMILDADLTVAPEDLPLFFEQIASGRGDFINGVRLLYPQEQDAMKFVNLLGNTFFGFALSWLMGQTIKDSLCGTKVFRRADYDSIMEIEKTLGDFDPFGDFELLFGAARAGLNIVDLPVHYGRRVAGQPKIETYRHGLKLFRMLWYGFLLFKVRS